MKEVGLHDDKCAILKICVKKKMPGLLHCSTGKRTGNVPGMSLAGGDPGTEPGRGHWTKSPPGRQRDIPAGSTALGVGRGALVRLLAGQP